MQAIQTLIQAKWLIPVVPENRVLENHSIAIEKGVIIDILPNAEALEKYQPATLHNLDQHAVIPGLINSHGHSAMTLLRGLADDLPLMEWLKNHIWPVEGEFVDYEFVKQGTQLAIAEMLRGGTTCINDMYFFPDAAAKAYDDAGMRATVGLLMIDFPTAWGSGPEEYLHKGIELHNSYRNHPLIKTAFAPHAPYTVSDEPLEKVRMYSDQLDIPIHIHVHETAGEVEQAVAQAGIRPIERLKQLGLLGPKLLAVHMTQLTDDEIRDIAEAGVHVVHCPESNLKLASGFCPVAKLDEAKVNVAIGTDGTASNNDLDMFSEMRTTALLAKGVAREADAIPAARALTMATINGARALGIDDVTGSLEIGKSADICAVNLAQLESQPLYNPISQLVYASNREQVSDVWVHGRHLLKSRKLTTLMEEELLSHAREWQEKISNR